MRPNDTVIEHLDRSGFLRHIFQKFFDRPLHGRNIHSARIGDQLPDGEAYLALDLQTLKQFGDILWICFFFSRGDISH